jgi:uncharacterized protein YjbI with pentapeptide repeats
MDLTDARVSTLRGPAVAATDPTSVQGADLSGQDLIGARAAGAFLAGSTLRYAKFADADLSGADLRWADLTNAILTDAKLAGADFTGAVLAGTKLDGACGNSDTRMPPGIELPVCADTDRPVTPTAK